MEHCCMYLSKLTICTDEGTIVREVPFIEGLNLILGRVSNEGSTNNVGKTTIIRCINFCLGGSLKEFYEDEETKTVNTKVKEFIFGKQLVFSLSFAKDLNELNFRDFVVSRQVTYDSSKKNPLKVINKIGKDTYNTDFSFSERLKYLLFRSDVAKPTFRQLIPKFVRRVDFQISNILKFLHSSTSQSDYELIHFFLFGFSLTDILNEKAATVKDLKQSIKEYKTLNTILPRGLEQKVLLLKQKLEEKTAKRDNFNIESRYEKDSNDMELYQEKLNVLKTEIINLNLDRSVLVERLNTLESSNFEEDVKTIEYIYEEANLLNIDIHRKFEKTVEFHNSMIKNEVNYLKDRIKRVENEIEYIQDQYEFITNKYNPLLEKLGNMGSLREYTELSMEIESLYTDISSIETQLKQLAKSYERKVFLETKVDELTSQIEVGIESFKSTNIAIFNTYLSKFSKEIYDEEWYISFSPNDDNTLFKFNATALTQNVGSGKKQMLVAAFDIAYMAFIQDDKIQLPFPKFATQDKVEIIDIQDLQKLKDLVLHANGQLILPIIEDKYINFSNPNIKDCVIVELTADDKFFRIENTRVC